MPTQWDASLTRAYNCPPFYAGRSRGSQKYLSRTYPNLFVAKVRRNVSGQYRFKTAEVTSDLDAAVFFGGIDLYSDHWVTSRILVLAGLPGTSLDFG